MTRKLQWRRRERRQETALAWKATAEEAKARGYNLDIKNPTASPTTATTRKRCLPS
ncbi:hypothetical protein [Rhodoblastus sp.]|uniref:hypothetical protein n=1 Tax=Rhodoblastus sp. TaxID=1962975 RepID=UPI003F9CCAC5